MKILLTKGYDETEPIWDNDPLDSFSNLEKGDLSFRFRAHQPCYGLHLMAQNLNADVTVLERHSRADFEAEVQRGYDLVGIQVLTLHTDRIADMIAMCRELVPPPRIVLGGPGVVALNYLAEVEVTPKSQEISRYILKQADAVCRGEGTTFLRRFIGDEPADRPITQQYNPVVDIVAHGLEGLFSTQNHMLIHALGCPNGCEFCASSSAFNKKRIVLLSARECFEGLKHHVRRSGGTAVTTYIQDDNFLAQPSVVRELGKLIREDTEYGLAKLTYSTFASLRSLASYDPVELLELGVSNLFLGVESTLDPVVSLCEKRTCNDMQARFDELHHHGITTTASFILGWDFHTHETILEDIRQLAQLGATMYHINLLGACPGTKLFHRLLEEGRIRGFAPDKVNCWTTDYMRYRPLTFGDLQFYLELAHRWTYQHNGPHPLRRLEVLLNGFAYCSQSDRLALRGDKARYFKEKCQEMYPILETCQFLAPNPDIYAKAYEIKERYNDLIGQPELPYRQAAQMARHLLVRAYEERRKQNDTGQAQIPKLCSHYINGKPDSN